MTDTNTPLIVGNWKMNGSLELAQAIAGALREQALKSQPKNEVVVCPPFPYLLYLRHHFVGTGLKVGGQNCHAQESGAHTGDISAKMLADIGCSYVIVGHSERRNGHQESDTLVCDKAEAAQQAGLTAIICVGENRPQREKGRTLEVLREQVTHSVPKTSTAQNVVLAYEPLWAIGTGQSARAAELSPIYKFLRQLLRDQVTDGYKIRMLYGGSVTPENAQEFIAETLIDGVLVGGASLKVQDFLGIIGCQ